MQAARLPKNGTIGMICPSHVADPNRYADMFAPIKRLGFDIKPGGHFYKSTYGYAASAEERAADLNALVSDKDVRLILFGGGESAVEILPYIDYGNIKNNPKLFSSYSDATPILNAIYARTGLVTYYGCGIGEFYNLSHYDYTHFLSHFVEGYTAGQFEKNSDWIKLTGGVCEGTLIGGYSYLFALMLTNRYFSYDTGRKYLLFLEDHETFSEVGAVASYLAFIGQSAFIDNVTGLIFGHYSNNVPDDLLRCLERFGKRHNIPVVYTHDFGHGMRHGIFPIGVNARLDADNGTVVFTSA